MYNLQAYLATVFFVFLSILQGHYQLTSVKPSLSDGPQMKIAHPVQGNTKRFYTSLCSSCKCTNCGVVSHI